MARGLRVSPATVPAELDPARAAVGRVHARRAHRADVPARPVAQALRRGGPARSALATTSALVHLVRHAHRTGLAEQVVRPGRSARGGPGAMTPDRATGRASRGRAGPVQGRAGGAAPGGRVRVASAPGAHGPRSAAAEAAAASAAAQRPSVGAATAEPGSGPVFAVRVGPCDRAGRIDRTRRIDRVRRIPAGRPGRTSRRCPTTSPAVSWSASCVAT